MCCYEKNVSTESGVVGGIWGICSHNLKGMVATYDGD